MSDVKVTPTEVDAIAAAELIEAYWHDSDASMMKLAASYRAGHRHGVFIRAMTAARLQGWNECREAAAKVADAHEASNYEQGEYGSGWDAASRSIADAIEALPCPSTPES